MVTQTIWVNTSSNNSCVSVGKYFYPVCASSLAVAFIKQSKTCDHSGTVSEKEVIDCLILGSIDAAYKNVSPSINTRIPLLSSTFFYFINGLPKIQLIQRRGLLPDYSFLYLPALSLLFSTTDELLYKCIYVPFHIQVAEALWGENLWPLLSYPHTANSIAEPRT